MVRKNKLKVSVSDGTAQFLFTALTVRHRKQRRHTRRVCLQKFESACASAIAGRSQSQAASGHNWVEGTEENGNQVGICRGYREELSSVRGNYLKLGLGGEGSPIKPINLLAAH